ncbi:MAG: serine hydrolase domain-containing protein [Candidatus Limnocylindrales bacterium]
MSDQPFRIGIDKLRAATRARAGALIEGAVPSVAPAVAVSVWQAGAPWFEAYAGWVDPESESVALGFGSLFDLASVSKLFTATAFLRLANDFKVDLDDPVGALIPEFTHDGPRGVDGGVDPLAWESLPTPAGREDWEVDPESVTWRAVLTHTGGLAPWHMVFRETGPPPPPGEPDPVSVEARWSAALEAIGGYRFVARPGEEFHYSDIGYMLLGMAVARRFGHPLPVAMQALVRDRLGLDSLTYRPVDVGKALERIVPTELDRRWRGRRCRGEVHDENAAGLGGVAGHAGLFATAHDVARFGVAWLRQDPRLRLERFMRTAVTNQTTTLEVARGLGWQVQPTDHLAPFSDAAYGHTGFTGTSLAVDPRRDLVVALLTNRVYHGRDAGPIERLRLDVHEVFAEATDAGIGPA